MKFLDVKGKDIITEDGKKIVLKGYGIGGWMNMEHFINGYPFVESVFRKFMIDEYGKKIGSYYFDKMLDNYLREEDIKFMKDIGFNSIRVPINYRHFEDDFEPFKYKESGFKRFNKLLKLAKKYELYLIIDLHSAQGFQNEDWHSDNYTGKALLWEYKHFQDRCIAFWKEITRRYKDEPAIAGYEIINEPVAENPKPLNRLYREATKEIRKIDKRHIIFLEGNRWGQNFEILDEPFDKRLVYTNHFYVQPFYMHDLSKYPAKELNIKVIKKIYKKYKDWADRYNVPMWSGEFGILYTYDKKKNVIAAKILDDQLSVVEENGHSWNLWTYKDVKKMGLVYLKKNSAYMKKINKFAKNSQFIQSINFNDVRRKDLFLYKFSEFTKKYLAKNFSKKDTEIILSELKRKTEVIFSEIMLPYYIKIFKNITISKIDEIMESWNLENCEIHEEVVKILEKHCK